MKKTFEVREFDTITCNEEYKDVFKVIPETVFNDLMDFIHEYTASEENADALDFLKIGYKRNVGNIITVKNYVGLIQMKNGYQIQILPKVTFSQEDEDDSKTKKIFIRMLRTLKDFPSKVFNSANLRIDKMNLYEVFINMYLQEARTLVKHSIKSSYVEQEDNLNYYKGKLQINEHIKRNLVHKEKFYMKFDEFHPNNPANKIVKSTLLKLQKLTSSSENSKEIRQLLTYFEQVDPSFNYEKDLASISIGRSNKDYENLIEWSKVFLYNKSFSTFSGSNNSRALLFPMEKVYESYVALHMKKAMAPYGWDISTQDRKYHLFTEPREQFALRPDIVLKKDDKTIILDTKWKRLINDPYRNYGISSQDMYQMYAYSKKYGTSEIWLLYPMTEEMNNDKNIFFKSDDETYVHIFFVDLENIEQNLKSLRLKIK